jgi:hypothetical protein
VAGGHIFDFYLEKQDSKTRIHGPFWYSFVMAHNIEVNDVATFKLPDLIDGNEEEEHMEYEEYMEDYVFEVTIADPNGSVKPFSHVAGMYVIYTPVVVLLVSVTWKFNTASFSLLIFFNQLVCYRNPDCASIH